MNKYPHNDNYGNLSTRFFSKNQEKRVAKQLGGKRQPNYEKSLVKIVRVVKILIVD